MKQQGVLPLPPDGQCSELRVERSWAERSGTLTSPVQCVGLLDKTLLSLHWPSGHCISYLSLWLVTTTHPPTHPQPPPPPRILLSLPESTQVNKYVLVNCWRVILYILHCIYFIYCDTPPTQHHSYCRNLRPPPPP